MDICCKFHSLNLTLLFLHILLEDGYLKYILANNHRVEPPDSNPHRKLAKIFKYKSSLKWSANSQTMP